MVHKALSIIRDEHRSIAAVLHGMQHLVTEIRERQAKVDTRVFAAMLYYLYTFCERVHHPKEDRYLFAPLRRRSHEIDSILSELDRDHDEGGRALRELEQHLARYDDGGAKEFPPFARAVEAFVENYWRHMRKEEEVVFPFAEKLFDADDWHVVDYAFATNLDPLETERETKDFKKLFDRIVNLAPPPIGVGPKAG